MSVLCEVLEVSRSGFSTYGHRPHTTARKEAAADALVARGKTIAAQTRYSYGSRRRAKQLQADGYGVRRYKARGLMQQAAVAVQRRPKRHPGTTDNRHRYGSAPNLSGESIRVSCLPTAPGSAWDPSLEYEREGGVPGQRGGGALL